MKKFLTLLSFLALSACANQSAQSTTAHTLLAMHDFVKIGAVAADGMCKQGIIQPAPCMEIKSAYDKIRAAYPLASDALVLYLKSGDKDTMSNFMAANALFVQDYQEITAMLIKFGVVKEVK
jgi:hypothetical protein